MSGQDHASPDGDGQGQSTKVCGHVVLTPRTNRTAVTPALVTQGRGERVGVDQRILFVWQLFIIFMDMPLIGLR